MNEINKKTIYATCAPERNSTQIQQSHTIFSLKVFVLRVHMGNFQT